MVTDGMVTDGILNVVVDVATKHGYIWHIPKDNTIQLRYRDNGLVGYPFYAFIDGNSINVEFWDCHKDNCDICVDLCDPDSLDALSRYFRRISRLDFNYSTEHGFFANNG